MFFYIVLTPISTTSGLRSAGNTRKYHQIDVYIYQYVTEVSEKTYWMKIRNCIIFMKKISSEGSK